MKAEQPSWLAFAPATFLVLWSTGYVAAKYGLAFAEPMTFLALRFGCVAAIMLIVFLMLRPRLPCTREDWLHLAVVGFLLQSLYFGMCYMAFKTGIAVGTLALILSLQPILVGLIAPRWVSERVGWKQWMGLLLGLLGAAIVIIARSAIEPPTLMAFLYGFLALLGITIGSLWEKRFGVSHHPVTANLVGFTVGFLGIVPFMLMLETMQIEWTWGFILALVYLIVGSSLVAVGLLLAMIRAGDVARVSALFFLVPPLAALVAWQLLDEVMPLFAWLGMAVAAVGVFLATYQQDRAVKTVD